jgi:hypothetical protein
VGEPGVSLSDGTVAAVAEDLLPLASVAKTSIVYGVPGVSPSTDAVVPFTSTVAPLATVPLWLRTNTR